jgi:hypothetical protein
VQYVGAERELQVPAKPGAEQPRQRSASRQGEIVEHGDRIDAKLQVAAQGDLIV